MKLVIDNVFSLEEWKNITRDALIVLSDNCYIVTKHNDSFQAVVAEQADDIRVIIVHEFATCSDALLCVASQYLIDAKENLDLVKEMH